MNPIELMEGFSKRLKAAERELTKLEREAKKLAEKQETIRAEHDSLRREIGEHEEAIRALEQEDSGLKNDLLEAMLSDDASKERNLKKRRKQIASEIEQHHKDIRRLRDSLDALEDTSKQAAEIAARLDMLNFGYAFGFGSRLRDALVQNELRLKSRQSTAKRELPTYSQDIYGEVRAELDEEYAAKQERGGMTEVEWENFQKRKAEQERKNESANREYVGVGGFGGNRRTEPDARDFSN